MALTNLSQVTSSGIHTLSNYTTHNINSTGIITATEFSGNLSSASGISTFSEIRVTGNLTVEGTTTTLDSVLNEVDRLEIGANTTAVGLALTQSGSGHAATFEGGNVGIGTNNPGATLHVRGSSSPRIENTGTISLIRFQNSSAENVFYGSDANNAVIYTQSTERLRITSAGLVGIGTSVPTSALEIRTTTTNAATHYRNNASNGGAYFGVRAADLGAAEAGEAYVYSYNSGINLLADGTGYIDFATGGTASKVRITSAGLVGIGITNPAETLAVVAEEDSNAIDNGLSIYRSVADDKVTINAQGGAAKFIADGGSSYIPFRFYRYNGTNLYETLTISSDGNIGIGTVNPSHKLDVVGNTQLFGTLVVGNNTNISPDANGAGQFQIDANGYSPYIAADGTAMYVGHNSSSRDLRLQTNETDRLTIDGSTGNIGIGTNDPGTSLLRVHGGTTLLTHASANDATSKAEMVSNAALRVRPHINNSGNLNFAQVNSGSGIGLQYTNGPGTANWDIALQPFGGQVGIGTTAPAAKLEVRDDSSQGIIVSAASTQQTDTNKALRVRNNNDTNTFSVSHRGQGYFSGSVGIGTESPGSKIHLHSGNQNQLKLESTQNEVNLVFTNSASTNNFIGTQNSDMYFYLNSATRLWITSDGNVKVGNFSTVDTRNTGGLHIQHSKGVSFRSNTSQSVSRNWRIRNDDYGWGNLDFSVGDSVSDWGDSAADVLLSLTSNRRVGINATVPQQRLDVVGLGYTSALFRPDASSSSAYGDASAVNNLIQLRMPYGVNAGSVSNSGARWGIQFTGRNDGAGYGGDVGKSASIYAVSEDGTAGYNRQVGLSFYTSPFDANQIERLHIKYNGEVRQQSTGGSTIYELKRTDSNTTGSVGTINFTASDGHSVASMGAMGDGDNEGAHLVFRTTSAAANNSPYNAATPERLRIASSGKVGIPAVAESSALLGINAASTSELSDSSGLYNQGNPCYLQIKNTTDSISDPECGIILQPRNSANGSVAIYAKRTGSYTSDLIYRVRTGSSTSAERLRIKNDGGVGIGIANPASKVHIRSTTSYGKDTYATAGTGGSQSEPPGTFRWDNATPVAASNGRGYRAWVQSGDAYPNASNYIDVLIRNAGFYRITLKRSHSSADAAVCQMMIYGLANSGNTNYPVVHMTGANGSGTATAAVSSGHGRGSSNAVATFYWEIHSYNVNTHDTIIRIHTTGSNNQGIVALIERI